MAERGGLILPRSMEKEGRVRSERTMPIKEDILSLVVDGFSAMLSIPLAFSITPPLTPITLVSSVQWMGV